MQCFAEKLLLSVDKYFVLAVSESARKMLESDTVILFLICAMREVLEILKSDQKPFVLYTDA